MKKLFLFLLIVTLIIVVFMYDRRQATETPEKNRASLGVNIGGWLSDEFNLGPDRFDCDLPSIHEVLRQRFSQAEADELLESYRDKFITTGDFERIKALGFDSIRLPVSAAHLYDVPGSSVRFDQMANRIEWALRQAETNGLAVILNLRIRPGEWAAQPLVRGRRFQARWSDRDVQSIATLWSRLAARFKTFPSLAGYDLTPGPCRPDVDWMQAYSAWISAISAEDRSKLIYAPWPRTALKHFSEDPAFRDITPGFSAEFISHAVTVTNPVFEVRYTLEQDIPRMDQFWAARGIPCLTAEFNPLLAAPGEADVLSRYIDTFQKMGWNAMFWTYKAIRHDQQDENHESVLTGMAQLGLPDFTSAAQDEIKEYISRMGDIAFSVPAVIQESLAKPRPYITRHAAGRQEANRLAEINSPGNGWALISVGDVECEMTNADDQQFTLTSIGLGVGGFEDEFGMIGRELDGNFSISSVVSNFEYASISAGAGLLVTLNDKEKSPYLAVLKTPDEKIISIVDHRDGQPVVKRTLTKIPGSNYLRITTDGTVLKASCSVDGKVWPVAANFTVPWVTNRVIAGAVVFGGHEYRTAQATFKQLNVDN